VNLVRCLVEKHAGTAAPLATTNTEVTIDYRQPNSEEAEMDRAKELYDQGLMNGQIAAQLGCGRNHVTKLIRRWHERRGLTVLDGRGRRKTLSQKQLTSTKYEELSEGAKALWDDGLADIQIAERLGCSAPTVVRAIEHWHRQRGLPYPTHADRRRTLVDRMQTLYEEGKQIRDIAGETGMCTRSVTLLLRERFASLGRQMPDGRTRRGTLDPNAMS
jgi:transposase